MRAAGVLSRLTLRAANFAAEQTQGGAVAEPLAAPGRLAERLCCGREAVWF